MLPPDEPEICVTESSAMLPEALTAKAQPGAEPKGKAGGKADSPSNQGGLAVAEGAAAAEGAATMEGAVAATDGAAAATEGAAAATEGAAAMEGAAAEEAQAALGMQVLHAHGGATRARAVAAAAANKFAPLYLPSAELLASVASFYG